MGCARSPSQRLRRTAGPSSSAAVAGLSLARQFPPRSCGSARGQRTRFLAPREVRCGGEKRPVSGLRACCLGLLRPGLRCGDSAGSCEPDDPTCSG